MRLNCELARREGSAKQCLSLSGWLFTVTENGIRLLAVDMRLDVATGLGGGLCKDAAAWREDTYMWKYNLLYKETMIYSSTFGTTLEAHNENAAVPKIGWKWEQNDQEDIWT
jgi:hypothetical protein